MDGFGGMLAIELAGGGDAADRFVRKLQHHPHAPSLGGVDSLVSRAALHLARAPDAGGARARSGIPDGFLRLSVGIEDADDLIADIEQALGRRSRVECSTRLSSRRQGAIRARGVALEPRRRFSVKKGEFVFLTGPSGAGK